MLAGPTITALQTEITAALTEELATVRTVIADGTETAPTLELPVVDGTTYPTIRRMVDEIAITHDVQWTPGERQRLVRRCLRSFGPADTHQACPYDVVVSLRRALNESRTPTLGAVERAAATLPAERFRPDLSPTATKLYATLLRAKGPLGRSALIEQADISASSYDRRLSDVRKLDRVTVVQEEGHRRWTTTDRQTPPVTAWLPPHSGHTTTALVTHQHTTNSWRKSRLSVHTGSSNSADWERRPPLALTTTQPETIMTPRDSDSPRLNSGQTHDTHPTHPDARTRPTTAVATPQTQLPTGDHR